MFGCDRKSSRNCLLLKDQQREKLPTYPKLEDVVEGPEKTSSPYCVIHDADVVQCKIWRQSTRQPFEAG
jgi:hypothetical protein